MRQLIQTSDEPVRVLAERLGVNPKTVMKWRHRGHIDDLSPGNGRSGTTILTPPEQEMCLAFRKATLLPLDDCLYALQLSLPHLTRATLHRLYRRHGISRLSDLESPLVARFVTQAHIPGDFYLNVAPVRTGDGIVNIYVAFDRVSRIAFAELHSGASSEQVAKFLSNLVDAVPYRVYGTLTNDSQIFIGRPYRQVRIRHGIDHQFLSPEDPWDIRQTASAKLVGESGFRKPHYDDLEHLRSHFFEFFDTYNFTRRLKSLSGNTPYEFICKCWQSDPSAFREDPRGWRLDLKK
ncbi:MAG: IS481 family transposase [Rhodospirillaceae bacterium]|nr:MAG: IS481 family transposase [Rhodospirillaceae bacterium]